jgi:predicted metal-dependent enzyme (double-stranded beta helix superfamily)
MNRDPAAEIPGMALPASCDDVTIEVDAARTLLMSIAARVGQARHLRCVLNDIAAELGVLAIDGAFDAALLRRPTNLSTVDHLGTDTDSGISMYHVADPFGERTRAHEHQTWAITVGLAGVERNQLFSRTAPGCDFIRSAIECEIGRGDTLVLLESEAHATQTIGSEASRHLHIYGQPLSALSPFDTRLLHHVEA